MALTADREVEFYTSQELIDIPVADDVVIYKGALVGIDASTGYARPLVAGDQFAGIAYRQADNTIDGHSAGGIRVRLHQNVDVIHACGVSQVSVGSSVYANSDSSLTLTSSGNSFVGKVINIESASTARVRCHPWN